MLNLNEFKFLGFDKAIEQGYDGEGLIVAFWDCIRKSDGLEHYKMTKDILQQGLPKATLVYVEYSGNPNNDMRKIIDSGAHICNISMIGFDISFINQINMKPYYPNYNEFIQKVLVVASSGNSKKEEYHYPSSIDKVWSTSAILYNYGKPKPAGFSTINNRVDSGMFTNMKLSRPVGSNVYYSGTSCSAPMQSCFFGQFYTAFKKNFGKWPEPIEAVKYGKACAQDMYLEGYDINTGYGVTIHDFSKMVDYVWDWKNQEYISKDDWLKKAAEKNREKR